MQGSGWRKETLQGKRGSMQPPCMTERNSWRAERAWGSLDQRDGGPADDELE